MAKEKLPQYHNTIMEWECPYCKDKLKSYSWEHHKMDTCKCGKSSIDLEEHYCRIIGDAKVVREYKKDKK